MFRALKILFALLFLFAAAVQYNDPDPVRWIAFYGAAFILSAWAALRPPGPPWWAPTLVAVAALAWSATVFVGLRGHFPATNLFAEFEMKSREVEEAREGIGLLLTAAWMTILAAAGRVSGAGPRS